MAMRIHCRFQTLFNQGQIVQRGDTLDMDVQGATFATWHPRRLLTGYSWDALVAAACLHPSDTPRDILLLGLAGGTMVRVLRRLFPACRITAVEIDAELVALAETHLHLDTSAFTLHIGDAYTFLRRTRRRFDVILDDVYLADASDVRKPGVHARKPAALYRRVLQAEGIAAVNLITDRPHLPVLTAVRNDLQRAFPCSASITPPNGFNQIWAAGDHLRKPDGLHALARRRFDLASDRAWWNKLTVEYAA